MIEHTDNPLIFNMEINKNKYANLAETKRVCPFAIHPISKIFWTDKGTKFGLKQISHCRKFFDDCDYRVR